MKNRKLMLIIIVVILVIIITISCIYIVNKQNENKAKQTLVDFVNLINEKNYEGMYNKVKLSSMNKEDFINRNKNIYEGIGSSNIQVEVTNIQKENNEYKISYHEKTFTLAGEINFDNDVTITKDYKLNWSSSFIFPQLGEKEKVRISTIKANRGEILDRNDKPLAANGSILSVGIVPEKLGDSKVTSISKIAELTGVTEDYINEQLNASWVKDDTFVPIKKIAESNTSLKEALLQIPGILINKEDGRVYPLGKEAGHLIGYVQAINSEELEKNEGKGYNTKSVIGKSGLEKAYEEKLRGIDGSEIYIVDEQGNKISEIIKQDKKDGNNVKITIDSNLQSKIYEQMKSDKGFFVVMHPTSGELLALVSTPTFDSNDFVVGMTTKQWNDLNNDENKPLYNRFIQKYCPGSTFKPITASIGLTTGKINEDEEFNYDGKSWQKDNSWGDYYITTLTAYNEPKNLLNGIIHSDNIYFAQAALKIGSSTFVEKLNKMGFNETLDFPLYLAKSQYANENSEKIEGETKLADSGYGQGSILVNPIHMASIYSAFANQGNMIKPSIIYGEDKEILKEEVMTKEVADTVKEALIQVVENKEGTANDMKISGTTIAGKTGTAELKTSKEDTKSGTLGWFDCFTVDKGNDEDLLIISMVENVQNNQDGGSHYLIKKIRTLL